MKRGPGSLYRKAKSLQLLVTRDRASLIRFVREPRITLGTSQRIALVRRFLRATNAVRGYHTLGEMLSIATEILSRETPVVVEAGVGPGGSTIKLSLAADLVGGRVYAFDTFRGIPDNDEVHERLDGGRVVFRKGAFRSTLPMVSRRLEEHGAPATTMLVKGRIEETLPVFDRPIDVAVLDLDLIASTRAALVAIWPKVVPGGVVISIDGQLRATHELVADAAFWRDCLGVNPPPIEGLWRAKMLRLEKPLA